MNAHTVVEVVRRRWLPSIIKLILGFCIFKIVFTIYVTSVMNGGDNREGSSGTIRSVIIANGAGLYPAYTGNRALYDNQEVNNNLEQRLVNKSLYMSECPSNSVLDIMNGSSDGLPNQVCRIVDGNGEWTCQRGWQQLSVRPFCKKSKQVSQTITKPEWSQVADDRKILFIHIPKTGGTSIETSFLFDEQRKISNGNRLGGHHKITEFDQEAFKDYHKFCMVRHPCSKLLSVWSYYTQGLGNLVDNQWAEEVLNNETVSSFTAFVQKTLLPDGPVDPYEQVHLQSQVGMIFDETNKFGLNQLLVFEKWNESIDALGQYLKEDLSVLKSAHSLSSQHKTCQGAYTTETWQKMTDIYALDFCTLGYSTDIQRTEISPPVDLSSDELTSRYKDCQMKISSQ